MQLELPCAFLLCLVQDPKDTNWKWLARINTSGRFINLPNSMETPKTRKRDKVQLAV